ncbi:hypothetical protein BUALT_Bualt10G0051400 [Buddleja alternifolia]|uniref:Uncharacterized protein n=1 Tax=Buddleja alternifolia TaxID=168488 RepID=A0AAV6X4C1_9LAMI|nr:hypothetical protein BUALT_Bualt10G0051400 [Buddleja alternifolia]
MGRDVGGAVAVVALARTGLAAAAAEAQNHHKYSIAFLPAADEEWRKLRKISKEQMFSRHRLDASEGLRRAKLEQLCDYLKECCVSSRAVNIEEAALTTTLNFISTTLFSVDFANYDSNSTHEYKEVAQGAMDALGALNLADFFPILKMVDPQGIKRRSEFCFAKLFAIFDDIINQRLESRKDGGGGGGLKKDDLLEALLDLRQGNEYDLSSDHIKHLLFLDINEKFGLVLSKVVPLKAVPSKYEV